MAQERTLDTNYIVQLKITLEWSKPPIWRRVLVDKSITFLALHLVIQAAMGWENDHLYEFKVGGQRIGEPDEEDFGSSFGNRQPPLNAEETTLESLITAARQKFTYEYDFGDGWQHQITAEKFLPGDKHLSYPACTDGALNCPPEDCGGIPGYYHLLEVITNKRHPGRKDMLEWLGGSFDPDYFDMDETNKKLRRLG